MAPEDQIWVKKGSIAGNRKIVVHRAVTILGGFDGAETDASERDWRLNLSAVGTPWY